jgi:hypothetical protein
LEKQVTTTARVIFQDGTLLRTTNNHQWRRRGSSGRSTTIIKRGVVIWRSLAAEVAALIKP